MMIEWSHEALHVARQQTYTTKEGFYNCNVSNDPVIFFTQTNVNNHYIFQGLANKDGKWEKERNNQSTTVKVNCVLSSEG